jgi:ADP-ribose pyrophosphatase
VVTAEPESLASTAQRELLEETGYEASEMRLLSAGPTSAGLSSEVITFFHATGLRKINAGGGDPHEEITVHEQPLDTLDDWLRERAARGALVDPKIFAGLYLCSARVS